MKEELEIWVICGEAPSSGVAPSRLSGAWAAVDTPVAFCPDQAARARFFYFGVFVRHAYAKIKQYNAARALVLSLTTSVPYRSGGAIFVAANVIRHILDRTPWCRPRAKLVRRASWHTRSSQYRAKCSTQSKERCRLILLGVNDDCIESSSAVRAERSKNRRHASHTCFSETEP